MIQTRARLLLTGGMLLLSAACHKKATVQVPVAAPLAPAPVASTPATAPEPKAAPPVPVAPTPAPAPPPTQTAKPSPFPPAATSPTPVRPAPVPVAPVPTPSLGAILTADQRTKLDAAYKSDLNQANTVLNGLRGRTLTPSQTDSVNRARAFIRQAAQYHDKDLATAAELARRARVLTQDLAGAQH